MILGYRIVISIYFVVNLVWAMIYFNHVVSLALLTNWSIILSTIYYLLITVSSGYDWIRQHRQSNEIEIRRVVHHFDESAATNNRVILGSNNNSTSTSSIVAIVEDDIHYVSNRTKIVWILYESSFAISILATVLYWGFVSRHLDHRNRSKAFLTISFHLVNFLLLLIDFNFHTIPVRLLHCIYPMIFAILYMVFSFVFTRTTGCLIYKGLDWKRDPTVGVLYVLLIIALVLVGQLLSYGLYRLKLKYCTVRAPRE